MTIPLELWPDLGCDEFWPCPGAGGMLTGNVLVGSVGITLEL